MRGGDARGVSTVHCFRPFHCHSRCNLKPEVIGERATACLCHGRSRYAYNNNVTFAAITEAVALTQLLIDGHQLRVPVMAKGWVKVFQIIRSPRTCFNMILTKNPLFKAFGVVRKLAKSHMLQILKKMLKQSWFQLNKQTDSVMSDFLGGGGGDTRQTLTDLKIKTNRRFMLTMPNI